MAKLSKSNAIVNNYSSGPPDSVSPNTDPLWTVEDVARYLRLEPETVRNLAREGKLPAIKIGRIWRFRKSSLDQILKEKIENAETALTTTPKGD